MVIKINISMPQEVLDQLDKAARDSKISRSAFLTEAVRHYIEQKEHEKKLRMRRQAVERIPIIAEKIGSWDATAEVIKWRRKH